jgi:hypothetical protein
MIWSAKNTEASNPNRVAGADWPDRRAILGQAVALAGTVAAAGEIGATGASATPPPRA